MIEIILTDTKLDELNKVQDGIQYRLFSGSNEADRNKMRAAFAEAGVIYPNMEEYLDIYRKQGIEFVVSEPKADYRAMLVKEGFTIEQDGSELKITNERNEDFLFCVMFEIDKQDYADIKNAYARINSKTAERGEEDMENMDKAESEGE